MAIFTATLGIYSSKLSQILLVHECTGHSGYKEKEYTAILML